MVRKYKTQERLARALRGLEDKGEVEPKTYEYWINHIESEEVQRYDSALRSELTKIFEDMKSDTPLGKLQKRKRKLGHGISPLKTTDKSTVKKGEDIKTTTTLTKHKGLVKKKHLLSIGD